MSKIDKEKINTALETAPESVRALIFSREFGLQFAEIVKKHKIHLDKTEGLSQHLLGVYLGLLSGVSLRQFIQTELGLQKEEADTCYNELLKTQLLPVQNAFREAQEKERKEMERKQAEEEGDDTYEPEQEFAPAPPSDEHALDNAPLGVLENNGMRERAAEPRAETPPARLETETVAHIVEEKTSITERKLAEATVSMPLASTNMNVAAEKTGGAAAEPPRLDRSSYHGQDPYREPIASD